GGGWGGGRRRWLGTGVADRAGDADDLRGRARPRGAREAAQSFEDVGHDKERRIADSVEAQRPTPIGGDDRKAGATPERGGDEVMAVAAGPLNPQESPAQPGAAAVRP